ncbi:FAD-binding oxidoreductase [Actinomycetospora cinnamomea]|uniref:FAD/FMN-containing dehydrogenase n=1 Tax=Actinomycetospora cinnamomea TaxID=663609 RepID=A0A2U1F181_9PSEU|nr:FAD-binding oxidoreductase [Actinomycetospora cinnamomea]PVZ05889.1 FAD/FMN-containing dehydrogenase [Actinomycetospora cinnamomea]
MTTSVTAPALLRPEDAEFTAAVAPFVTTLTPRPDLVVAARSPGDVVAAVRWAGAEGRPVTVQATGHQLVSDLAGSVLISTRDLDGVRVDPVARTAVVGGGARWKQVIAASAPHGLAPVSGSSSNVGVAGFCLGGGHGPLSRAFGTGADQVRRIRVVTADGIERDVDATREPDLFAVMCGGKAGFGVVTEIEIALHPVSRLYGGGIFFPGEASPQVLHAWREWIATLPDEASSSVALLRLPPDPSLPPPLQGAFVAHLRFAYLGTAEEGAALLAPMRAVAEPVADMVDEMPFAAIDAIHADPTEPMPVWDDSATLSELPAEAVDALLAAAGPGVDTPLIIAELRQLGGAIARRPDRAHDAVAGRDAGFTLYALAPMFPPVAAIAPAATRAVVDALRPRVDGGLPNFQGLASGGRLGALWDAETLAWLTSVREQYDPAGMFRTVGLR